MENIVSNLREAMLAYAPGVVAAFVILLLGWWVAKGITALVRRGMNRANVDPTLTGFLGNLLYMVLMGLVIISALGKLGVNTTSFAAILGASALAVGLALQGSLGNFASGVMLIFFRPFKAGDFVEAGGVSGVIQEVRIFATVIHTPDNKRIIVPNGAIIENAITNYSANDTRRIDLVIGIGYDDDIRQAKALLLDILRNESRVLAAPEPTVGVVELADSSVNFVVRPWVRTNDYWDVRFALTEEIKLKLDANGISIPFPQRDVHLKHNEAA